MWPRAPQVKMTDCDNDNDNDNDIFTTNLLLLSGRDYREEEQDKSE